MSSINKVKSADLRSYARLTFKTSNKTFQVVNSLGQTPGSFEIGNNQITVPKSDVISSTILSVTTSKTLANSSGVFTINLSPRIVKSQSVNLGTTYLPNIIKPFTLVQIEFKVDDSGYHTEMIGFVTRASIKTAIQEDGTPNRVFHIEGCDLTKALQSYMLYFNPFIYQAGQYNLNGLLYAQGTGKAIFGPRNPRDFALIFMDLALNGVSGTSSGIGQPYFGFYFSPVFRGFANPAQQYVQSGIRLDDLIDFKSAISTEFVNMRMTDPYILLEMVSDDAKSLWDIMKSYSDPPFHEAFIDLRRPIPSDVSVVAQQASLANAKASSQPTEVNILNAYTTSAALNEAVTPPNLNSDAVAKAEATHKFPAGYSSLDEKQNNPIVLEPATSTSPAVTTTNLNLSASQPYNYYMRTTPFSEKNWYGLNVHYFSTADILSSDVSTSEENIFNYFEVLCSRENAMPQKYQLWALSDSDHYANYNYPGTKIPRIPIFDYQSILTYGLRKLSAVTKYVDFVNQNSANGEPSYEDVNKSTIAQATLIRELFRWFSFGDDFESGTFVLKGRVGIGPWGMTIGSRLVELYPGKGSVTPTGKQYYIESVSQVFELGKPLMTTIGVTRGHYPSDYTDPVTKNKIIGRFSKVRQLENFMKLSQSYDPNQQLFYDIPE